ncbi:MAG: uroporphyrinogen decarboxylase family protein [Phycisphaerales bacterium]
MNSKQRMNCVMNGKKPDRIPVMCQLSLGHIYKNTDINPFEFWYTAKGLSQGYIQMADRYKFDGILVNKPGIDDPALKDEVKSIIKSGDGYLLTWKNGLQTFFPPDDDPRDIDVDRKTPDKKIASIDIDMVRRNASEPLTPYYLDPLKFVISARGADLSIHGEVSTVFESFLLLLGSYENGLMALVDDPDKSIQIMQVMNQKVIRQARAQCELDIDALKLSSPIAGAGFISRQFYKSFVLPFEKEVIDTVHKEFKIPCYIHTCGAIGDRLDLMLETGTDGLECLDPPPLGTVDLAEAVETIGSKVFIKGNLDSVNELIKSSEEIREIVLKRLEIGSRAKGYILSSACSVSPKVPPENIVILHDICTQYQKKTCES